MTLCRQRQYPCQRKQNDSKVSHLLYPLLMAYDCITNSEGHIPDCSGLFDGDQGMSVIC